MKPNNYKLILAPVSPANQNPLYEQIVEGIKQEISAGRLKPGQPLPSFRALAEDLLVSLITVKRAYEELERQEIIYSKQGLGTFVAEAGDQRNREMKSMEARQLMQEALTAAIHADMNETKIVDMVRQLLQEKTKGINP